MNENPRRLNCKQSILFVSLLALGFTPAGASSVSAQEAKPKPADSKSDVRIERDLEYLGPDRKEKADLYLPKPRPDDQRGPAVLIIHGGGWVGGDKGAKREINIGTTLASHGYVAMSINYVLAPTSQPQAAWPRNLHDCKTAVRWLKLNADRLRINPDRIGVIGGSAGGHLAAMVGVTGPEAGLDPDGPQSGPSYQVRAVVDMYGPLQIRTDSKTSPVAYLDKNDPPFLLLHGTADKTVPVAASEQLAQALAKADIPHQLVIIEGAPHTFDLQPKQRDLRPLVLEFFDKHLRIP